MTSAAAPARPLSLHHLSLLTATPDELVEAAVAGGFSHCGIRIVSPDDARETTPVVDDDAYRARLGAHLREAGVAVLDVEALWLRPGTDVDAIEPAVAAAAELGASSFLTVGHDPDRARLIDTVGRFADVAARHDLAVPLEFITYTAVPTLADAAAVVAAVSRPNVKVLIDSLQFFRAGADFACLDALPADLIPYVQLADGHASVPADVDGLRAEARTDRLPPGEGALDLARFLRAIPPGIPLAVEAPTLALRDEAPTVVARRLGDATRSLLDSLVPEGPLA